MARETRIKLKRGNDWVDADEIDDYRRAKASEQTTPMPTIDVGALPTRAKLNKEWPLEDLFYNNEPVRRYLTLKKDKKGKVWLEIRQGIPAEFKAIAQDILRKYSTPRKKKAKKTVKKTTKRTRRTS